MDPADVNLTFLGTTPDYYKQSSDMDYETSNETYPGSLDVLQKMSIALYSIAFLLGTIGNGLFIWIAYKRSFSTVWFLNLAIADLLCCLSLPLRIAELVSSGPFGLCELSSILFDFYMTARVLSLTAMSIDNCLVIKIIRIITNTHDVRRKSAALIWVFSLLFTGFVSSVYVFYCHGLTEWCAWGKDYRPDYYRDIQLSIQLVRLVIMFLIPFLIVLISYVTVFLSIRRTTRLFWIDHAVRLCFCICWCLYYICPLTPMYYQDDFQFRTVNLFITNLAVLISCVNPIIQVCYKRNFTTFKDLFLTTDSPSFINLGPIRLRR